ncbi:hypothetical protein QAD02_012490 [Eretmocerus hayati]|uniref:Uncharacterized protein n=1 Tax=Eretmocerus hayati TaxID=131215 RepID=A0ACC2NZV4_9HYME|nr:hypothetical protein QAD02_012490 [Eretmocerus hayati]
MHSFLKRPVALDNPRTETVRTFRKSFSILDSIDMVAESWAEIQESTLRWSWNKLWPENSCNASPRQALERAVPELLATAEQISCEGFADMREAGILELLQPQDENLLPDEIEVMMEESHHTDEPDAEELFEETLTAKAVAEVLNHFHAGVAEALDIDPIMTRSLRLKHEIENVIRLYEDIFRDLVRRTRQSRLTEFFEKKAT